MPHRLNQKNRNLLLKLLQDKLPSLVPSEFSSAIGLACVRFSEAVVDFSDKGETKNYSLDWLINAINETEGFAFQLAKVWVCSNFALDTCCRYVDLFQSLVAEGEFFRSYQGADNHYQEKLLRSFEFIDESQLIISLRRFRQQEILRIIWRDLTGLASLEETTRDMSLLADASVSVALDYLHKKAVQKYGQPLGDLSGEPQQLLVLGMGKLGAYELNVSSDIDLIFTFPEAGETQHSDKSISNQEFFTRLGKDLIRVIDSRTVDGFVFRVDMRLRPNGQSGPLALNFSAIEDYYQQHGREWERYALIKARVITGSPGQAKTLFSSLRPFIYRKYLDFGAIDSLRDMKQMITEQVKRQNLSQDVKLGSGGIREIEFIVQSFQLIHGGRNTDYQQANLLIMLTVLAESGCLSQLEARQLGAAYRFLRDTEHALQAWRDEQTQQLPSDSEALGRLGFALDYANSDDFLEELSKQRAVVSGVFANIVAGEDQGDSETDPGDVEQVLFWRWVWQGHGAYESGRSDEHSLSDDQSSDANFFPIDSELVQLVDQFRETRRVQAIEKSGRERLDKFMPLLLCMVSDCNDPLLAMQRMLPFIESVLRRTAYLALLIENQSTLTQLVNLCETSPWIAEQLATYPSLLDELLDHRNLYRVPDNNELADDLRQQLLRVQSDDLEAAMDVLRQFKLAHGLRVAVCQISGALPLVKISDYLTHLAEVILQAVLELAWAAIVDKYGVPVRSNGEPCGTRFGSKDFIVLGYGKLGGIELGPTSDLDLVFIHDAGAQKETLAEEHQKSIANEIFFNRLGQRVIHILTTQTISGALYEVDMRLRPSGTSGLLVSGFESFAQYQNNKAWTWEHQALVRARVVAGDASLQQRVNDLRQQVICQVREPATLRDEVMSMRKKMAAQLDKPMDSKSVATNDNGPADFSLKQSRGGIIDIEFLVQYCVLAYANQYPQLALWTDNIRLLDSLAESGILTTEESAQLSQAYQDYRAAAHLAALRREKDNVSAETFNAHRQHVQQVWSRVFQSPCSETMA